MSSARYEWLIVTLTLLTLTAPSRSWAIDNVPGVCSAGCGPNTTTAPSHRREPSERPRQPTADEIRAERERRENQRRVELGQAAYQAGLVEEQTGGWAAAEARYRAALRHWGPWEVCFRMAYVLDQQGKYQEAATWYEQAIMRTYWVAGNRDHLPVVHTNLGLMQLRLGKPEEAARQFRRALDLNPRYQKAQDNLASLQRAQDAETARRMTGVLQSPVAVPPPPPSVAGLAVMDIQGTAAAEAHTNRATTQTGLRGSDEKTQVGASQVFDNSTTSSRLPAVAVPIAPAPAVQALTKHIPQEATKDQAIRESIGWYSQREKDKAETQAKIVKVQEDIKAKKGDPTVLKAYEAQLTNNMKQIAKDQQTTQQTIKKRLVNLGFTWKENPEPESPKEAKP
jgi:tetratricopeptide (TPR) repeat protein